MLRPSIIVAAMLSFAAATAAQWQPAKGPLMTRWAKDVSPQKVHPEYPRPQMVREEWLNLNGLWDYAITGKDEITTGAPAKWDGQILVPFPVESALSGVMKRVGPEKKLWYHRRFTVPKEAAWKGKRILLHFGASDWHTVVWVNGMKVGEHKGGYDPFSFDITDALGTRKAVDEEIVVSVWDPTNAGHQPVGKQHNNPHGIWYTPVTGIWQTVWIEPVDKIYIESIHITADLDKKSLRITVNAKGPPTLYAVVLFGQEPRKTELPEGEVKFVAAGYPVNKPAEYGSFPDKVQLWSPETPALYHLIVGLYDESDPEKEWGHVFSYYALRKISLGKDDRGNVRMMLNNKPYFQFGPLDQGWWPDGLYTAPTDEALRNDIEITKKLGFNMIRKHVKTEPARWYYHCDRLGMLVWQDMPNGDKHAKWDPVGGHDGTEMTRSKESSDNHDREWKNIIDALRNHPCIVAWVPFNEGWGQADTVRVTEWTKKYDPTRLVNCASGGNDFPVGDIYDIHRYPGPAAPKPDGKRAIVLGEFGGLGLPIEGHTWLAKGNWGYRSFTDSASLTSAYVDLVRKLRPLIHEPGLSAAIYTQTTDVEVEVNGFMTYDRAVMKMDEKLISEWNRKVYLPPPVVKQVVATALQEAIEWRYTTQKPADGWEKPGFDDGKWAKGEAGFGEPTTPGTKVRTQWKTDDIWIRRSFELPADRTDFADVMLDIHHDEDSEIHINGVLAAKVAGYTTGYSQAGISDAARKTLKPGKNTIAVHTHQTGGGQYIDVGLVEVKEQGGR